MEKVLLIDDDVSVHRLIEEEMKDSGLSPHLLIHAYSGAEGVQKYKDMNPKFVILDARMPGMNGSETCDCIKQFDPNALVYLLTGYCKDDAIRKTMESNVIGTISKNEENCMSRVVSLICAMLATG